MWRAWVPARRAVVGRSLDAARAGRPPALCPILQLPLLPSEGRGGMYRSTGHLPHAPGPREGGGGCPEPGVRAHQPCSHWETLRQGACHSPAFGGTPSHTLSSPLPESGITLGTVPGTMVLDENQDESEESPGRKAAVGAETTRAMHSQVDGRSQGRGQATTPFIQPWLPVTMLGTPGKPRSTLSGRPWAGLSGQLCIHRGQNHTVYIYQRGTRRARASAWPGQARETEPSRGCGHRTVNWFL